MHRKISLSPLKQRRLEFSGTILWYLRIHVLQSSAHLLSLVESFAMSNYIFHNHETVDDDTNAPFNGPFLRPRRSSIEREQKYGLTDLFRIIN